MRQVAAADLLDGKQLADRRRRNGRLGNESAQLCLGLADGEAVLGLTPTPRSDAAHDLPPVRAPLAVEHLAAVVVTAGDQRAGAVGTSRGHQAPSRRLATRSCR